MAHQHEHRDATIAFAVGGAVLVLILLYMFGSSANPIPANSEGEQLPTVTATAPRGQTAYNYNIAPYNPDPVLPYGKSSLPPLSSGCCDKCGPNGQSFNDNSVAQYMTLLQMGGIG